MKVLLPYSIFFICIASAQAYFPSFSLGKEQGAYRLDSAASDPLCEEVPSLDLIVAKNDVEINLSRAGITVKSERIRGVNTGYYTRYSDLTHVIYTRHVYTGGQLKQQSSSWGLGVIPAPYSDSRIILSVLGGGRISYDYDSYRGPCYYQKVDPTHPIESDGIKDLSNGMAVVTKELSPHGTSYEN